MPPPSSTSGARPTPPQAAQPAQAPVQPTQQKKPSGMDLLGDLGGDPFAAPPASQAQGGFIYIFIISQLAYKFLYIIEYRIFCTIISTG